MTADPYESLGEFDLVLLHGGGLNAHTWDVFALAAKRPLLAVDLPGHGEPVWREDGAVRPGRHRPGGRLSGVRP
jgi:pimeloyl-ACP methyl ester carboxylesterase